MASGAATGPHAPKRAGFRAVLTGQLAELEGRLLAEFDRCFDASAAELATLRQESVRLQLQQVEPQQQLDGRRTGETDGDPTPVSALGDSAPLYVQEVPDIPTACEAAPKGGAALPGMLPGGAGPPGEEERGGLGAAQGRRTRQVVDELHHTSAVTPLGSIASYGTVDSGPTHGLGARAPVPMMSQRRSSVFEWLAGEKGGQCSSRPASRPASAGARSSKVSVQSRRRSKVSEHSAASLVRVEASLAPVAPVPLRKGHRSKSLKMEFAAGAQSRTPSSTNVFGSVVVALSKPPGAMQVGGGSRRPSHENRTSLDFYCGKGDRECGECGFVVQDNKARFCTKCGTGLERPRACPTCEEALAPGDTFCARCGHRIGQMSHVMSSYEVHAQWKLSPGDKQTIRRSAVRRSSGDAMACNDTRSFHGSVVDLGASAEGINRFLLHPSSRVRLIWDLLTMIFVTWDVIVVPMTFLDIEETDLLRTGAWLLRVFWTVDLVMSFLTGYHDSEGKLVMSSRQIARHYVRSWFSADFSLVLIDWVTFLLETQAKAASIARIGKTVRAMRMIRMARGLRVAKVLSELLPAMEYYLRSEMSVVVLGVSRVMMSMLVINHFFACIWYGLGQIGDPDAKTWLKEGELRYPGVGDGYAVALHWSLTQFIGSMEVNPVNTGERVFAICVLMFAFLALCVLPAKITSLMTHFQITSSERSQALSQLSQYLYDQGVSRYLAVRLQRAATSAITAQRRKTPESKIVLLDLVSDTLKMELHYEMYCRPGAAEPGLQAGHPFFSRLQAWHLRTMQKICHHAVSPLEITEEEELLFGAGESPERPLMYVLLNGELKYCHQDIWDETQSPKVSSCCSLSSDASPVKPHARKNSESWLPVSLNWKTDAGGGSPEIVEAPACFCEAALWTHWVHHGSMESRTQSELLVVDAAEFVKLKESMPPSTGRAFCRYAERFVSALNRLPANEVTDLENFDIDLMADWAYEGVSPTSG